jgi:hypothetical protein
MFVRLFVGVLPLALIAVAGCATGPPDVGSRVWHEQRILEIEAAHDRGELTAEQYLSLKNEADATRAEYRASMRSYPPPYYSSPFFHHHHHFHRHH